MGTPLRTNQQAHLQTVREAEGYALGRINHARGDSARFVALYEAYAKAPEVTRQRLYLETMQNLLPLLGGKIFIDEDAQGVLPLLPLDLQQRLAPGSGGGPGGGQSQEDNR